jgi:hypothetical protein
MVSRSLPMVIAMPLVMAMPGCRSATPASEVRQPVLITADLRCASRSMIAQLTYDTTSSADRVMRANSGRLWIEVRADRNGTRLQDVLVAAAEGVDDSRSPKPVAMTNSSGNTMLELSPGVYTISVSLIGFLGGSVPVVIRPGMTDSLALALDYRTICESP